MNEPDYHRRDMAHYRSIRKVRDYMAYTHAEYVKDWEAVIALSVLMEDADIGYGPPKHLETLMKAYWIRIYAYLANTGEVPWETQ